MTKIQIKPLSVNQAYVGKLKHTKALSKYQNDVTFLLPKIAMPPPPYEIYFKFGFSSASSDIDNPVKILLDLLAKKYEFNDKLIYRLNIEREQVKKGKEYIEFKIDYFEN